MRALLPLLLLSTACATLLRPSTREVTVRGPENLRVLDNGRELPTKAQGPGLYVASVHKDAKNLTVESDGVQAPVVLSTHVAAGWVVGDILLGIWPIIIDAAGDQLTSFDEADAATPLALASGRGQPRGAVPAVASKAADRRPVARLAALSSGKLAVLDFRNFSKDLQPDNVRYFTDVVRGASLKAAPGLEVMTRENLLVLLQATGKDAAACEGECEVDTGRRIGADAVITGEVLKVGSRYKISLKLHETHDGRLLSTGVASGKTIDEPDEGLQNAATDLLAPPR